MLCELVAKNDIVNAARTFLTSFQMLSQIIRRIFKSTASVHTTSSTALRALQNPLSEKTSEKIMSLCASAQAIIQEDEKRRASTMVLCDQLDRATELAGGGGGGGGGCGGHGSAAGGVVGGVHGGGGGGGAAAGGRDIRIHNPQQQQQPQPSLINSHRPPSVTSPMPLSQQRVPAPLLLHPASLKRSAFSLAGGLMDDVVSNGYGAIPIPAHFARLRGSSATTVVNPLLASLSQLSPADVLAETPTVDVSLCCNRTGIFVLPEGGDNTPLFLATMMVVVVVLVLVLLAIHHSSLVMRSCLLR
jgi:hypothetical protein